MGVIMNNQEENLLTECCEQKPSKLDFDSIDLDPLSYSWSDMTIAQGFCPACNKWEAVY